MDKDSDESICCSMDEGVGDLVMGKDENTVEGEGKLATLPSLDPRLGLPDESYGLTRFGPEILSFFRFEGARESGITSVKRPPAWAHSVSTFMNAVAKSACRNVLADGTVLWSSVIMMGLDDPVPTIRPT